MKIVLSEDDVKEMLLDTVNKRLATNFNNIKFDTNYSTINSVSLWHEPPEAPTRPPELLDPHKLARAYSVGTALREGYKGLASEIGRPDSLIIDDIPKPKE